jgi:endonuclease/exonuclease/phosphatase family metal-dependent hydrolase
VELSVAHWNVWYRQDIRELPSFLSELDADVLCLCELTRNHDISSIADGASWLADQLGLVATVIELPLTDTPGGPAQVNAVLTALPVSATRHTYVNTPDGSGGYADEHRGYVEVTVSTPGGPVHIGETHLSYTDRFTDTPRKTREAEHLAAYIRNERSIVCGDFNTVPGTAAYAALTQRLRAAGPATPTWTTKPFAYNDFTETELRWPLDSILLTADLTATSYTVIPTDLSDHLPVRATVLIPDHPHNTSSPAAQPRHI